MYVHPQPKPHATYVTTQTQKSKGSKKQTHASETEGYDDDLYCMVCFDPYSASKSGEEWVTCQGCRQWAHLACTRGDGTVSICYNCDGNLEKI